MREMGKSHSSVLVLRIWPKFWWMVPIGVRDNHTKYEPKAERWRPAIGVAGAGPPLKICNSGAKTAFFGPNPPQKLPKIAK